MKKDRNIHSAHKDNTGETCISRRSFIKTGTVLGASSILAGSHITGLMTRLAFAADFPDLASVQGTDAYANALRAVEMLGGMGRFVSKQSRVALLINSNQDKGHGNNKIYHTACLFTWFPRCANGHIFQYAPIGAP